MLIIDYSARRAVDFNDDSDSETEMEVIEKNIIIKKLYFNNNLIFYRRKNQRRETNVPAF